MAAVFSGYEETRLGNILLWKRLFYPDLSISFLLGKRYDPMYVLTTFSSSKLLSFKSYETIFSIRSSPSFSQGG